MMKIVLLMKEYIGLHIDLQSFVHTLLHHPINVQNTTCLRKQQATNKLSYLLWKDNVFSFSNKLVFLENPMYTIVYK
jgi:hypothetical protein